MCLTSDSTGHRVQRRQRLGRPSRKRPIWPAAAQRDAPSDCALGATVNPPGTAFAAINAAAPSLAISQACSQLTTCCHSGWVPGSSRRGSDSLARATTIFSSAVKRSFRTRLRKDPGRRTGPWLPAPPWRCTHRLPLQQRPSRRLHPRRGERTRAGRRHPEANRQSERPGIGHVKVATVIWKLSGVTAVKRRCH
jgi:hypothetical protein